MSEPDGLLDTNPFIHAHATDRHSEECRAFLAALEAGEVHAQLEPIILHELSYALPHFIKQMTREQVADYLLMVLAWPGVHGDKEVMIDAVERWRKTAKLGFADSFLAALAQRRHCVVYTKNVREFAGQGISVPSPLPSPTRPHRAERAAEGR